MLHHFDFSFSRWVLYESCHRSDLVVVQVCVHVFNSRHLVNFVYCSTLHGTRCLPQCLVLQSTEFFLPRFLPPPCQFRLPCGTATLYVPHIMRWSDIPHSSSSSSFLPSSHSSGSDTKVKSMTAGRLSPYCREASPNE